MLKMKYFVCVVALVATVVVGGWFQPDLDSRSNANSNLPLQRSPEVIAEKMARKQGDAELRADRAATMIGRDEYWKIRLGEVPDGYLMKLKEESGRVPLLNQDKDGGLPDWTWLGPGNIGGRVRALVIDPTNPQTMWLGGVSGGIWKSTNGGNWWNPVNDFMSNLAVSCMVMTPDREFLLAGTGEGFNGGFVYAGAGIFRSADLGETWEQLPGTTGSIFRYVNRLAAHPDRDGRVYAVTREPQLGPDAGFLYRSDSNGNFWSTVLNLGAAGYDIKITNVTSDGTPWIMIGCHGDLHLSTDDGASFTSMVNGAITTPLPGGAQRIEVAFGTSVGNDPILYASLNRNNGELWRSTDGGNTWTARNAGGNIFVSGGKSQGNYDNVLWVEPGNPNRVIWGGVDLFTSGNGGTTFAKASDWSRYHDGLSAHADQHIIVPHPNYGVSNSSIFFGNDGGVQSDTNVWNTGPLAGWNNMANGLGITQFYHGDAAPDGSVVMGGAQDNSFLRFTGGSSESWFQQATGDGAYVAVNPDDPTTIYASTQYLNLRRSRNGGNSYTNIGNNIPEVAASDTTVLFIAPFKIDKANSDALFAGGAALWRSVDEGNNWIPLRPGNPIGPFISAIEQSAADPNRVYIGYSDGTISVNVANYLTWINVQETWAGMPTSFVTDIAVNPSDANDVIVAFSDFGNTSLWRSSVGGTSWFTISETSTTPLPTGPINTVTFHPDNSNWIYVGMDSGVFATEDGGENWSRTTSYPVAEGPVNTKVTDLFWGGERLYAATYGRGMYVTRPLAHIYVDIANAGNSGQDGSDANPYGSVNQGELAAGHGTNITVEGGNYDEVNGLDLKKRGVIKGRNGTVIVK